LSVKQGERTKKSTGPKPKKGNKKMLRSLKKREKSGVSPNRTAKKFLKCARQKEIHSEEKHDENGKGLGRVKRLYKKIRLTLRCWTLQLQLKMRVVKCSEPISITNLNNGTHKKSCGTDFQLKKAFSKKRVQKLEWSN